MRSDVSMNYAGGMSRPTGSGRNCVRSWMPCRATPSIVPDVMTCCDSRPRRLNKAGCCLMKKSGSVASGSDWSMRIGSGNWSTRLMPSCRRMSKLSSPGWGGSREPLQSWPRPIRRWVIVNRLLWIRRSNSKTLLGGCATMHNS